MISATTQALIWKPGLKTTPVIVVCVLFVNLEKNF